MLSIMLVDDDIDEYDLFTSALKLVTEDYKLVHVTGCDDLLASINKNKPDIVFLDINMPAVSGIECLKHIRAQKNYSSLPVIMYSTSSNQKYIEQSYENKANFYVVKPYSLQGITKTLEKIITIDWQLPRARSITNFVIG